MNNNWIAVKAGDIFENAAVKGCETERVLAVTQDKGTVYREDCGIDIKFNEDSLNTYKLVEEGDFVISLRSFQGGIEYSDLRGIVSPAYTILKNKIEIHKEFFRYYFKSSAFINKLSKAVVGIRDGKQISYNVFKTLEILLPSIKEQKAIADILKSVDKVIGEIDYDIDYFTQLKKALVEKLLTEGIRHTEFKDSEAGRIPIEWEIVSLDEISERVCVGYVGTCNKDYTDENNGVKMIRTTNLSVDKIIENDIKYVTYEFHQKNKKSQLRKNDVLIARHGDNGKACVFDGDFEANCLNIVIIRPNQKVVNSHFLKESINSKNVSRQISLRTVGSVQNVLNTKTIAELRIAIPPLNEQINITKILNEMDLITSKYIEQKSDYTQLKKGLMQQLLTGKIRVKVED